MQQTLGENPNVEDTARATDLALKRLERDLGRGEVDEELLRELGWTPERLSEFVERMQNQLQQLKSTEDATTAEILQKRRTEALLESLDLSSKGSARSGTSDTDREQQDTATRRRPPPPHLRERLRNYQDRIQKNAKRRR